MRPTPAPSCQVCSRRARDGSIHREVRAPWRSASRRARRVVARVAESSGCRWRIFACALIVVFAWSAPRFLFLRRLWCSDFGTSATQYVRHERVETLAWIGAILLIWQQPRRAVIDIVLREHRLF